MNAPATPAPRPTADPVRSLAEVEARAIAPLDWPEFADGPEARSAIYRAGGFLRAERRGGPDHWIWDKAQEVLSYDVDEAALAQLPVAISRALSASPDRKATALLIGLLIDAFPAGRPANMAVYVGSMAYDLADMGFGPAIVAMACREVRRSATFLPTIAELVKACSAARKELEGRRSMADRLNSIRADAKAISALPEPDEPVRVAPMKRGDGDSAIPF